MPVRVCVRISEWQLEEPTAQWVASSSWSKSNDGRRQRKGFGFLFYAFMRESVCFNFFNGIKRGEREREEEVGRATKDAKLLVNIASHHSFVYTSI
mmetsp:Transcript_15091/g.33003  ORF Transcript_15091/g.33003 Transcript_15091/m.33003 type:complete len:96 (+) Transcript_15091:822-1109(+)